MQAVHHRELRQTQVVFYKRATIALLNGLLLAIDQPAMVIVQPISDGLRITCSNPEHRRGLKVNIRVTGRQRGNVMFTFPSNDFAAKSITKTLKLL